MLSARPPGASASGRRFERPFERFDVTTTPAPAVLDPGYGGPAEVEVAIVGYGRDGEPHTARMFLRTPSGARAVASSVDPDVLAAVAEGRDREPGAAVGLPVLLDGTTGNARAVVRAA